MTRTRCIQQIAGEHRIELESRERDAVPRQDHDVELQVVTELANRRILEQRTQSVQCRLEVELLGRARTCQQIGAAVFPFMPNRNVPRLTIADGECEADYAG